jgi:hypothetical protein
MVRLLGWGIAAGGAVMANNVGRSRPAHMRPKSQAELAYEEER